jgi:Hsp70 protein
MKDSKKMQQRGRKRARDVAKDERKYRQEKKNIRTTIDRSSPTNSKNRSRPMANNNNNNNKVRDGISGRPISRIVLVGGATRMPAIGRILTAITGVVPQRTVNPDEAVALGCAIQVGILDGIEGMGTVLTPMQSAILRAVASERGFGEDNVDDDEDEFDSGEVY